MESQEDHQMNLDTAAFSAVQRAQVLHHVTGRDRVVKTGLLPNHNTFFEVSHGCN